MGLGVTHGLPRFCYVYLPCRGKANPRLCALRTIVSKRGETQETHNAHNPTVVTNTVRQIMKRLSVCSGAESHEESCARTRPVSRPCTKRPTMPGERVCLKLGTSAVVPRALPMADELDMTDGEEVRERMAKLETHQMILFKEARQRLADSLK